MTSYARAMTSAGPTGGYDPRHFDQLFQLEAASFWFKGRSDLINWALDKQFPTAESFLELGCGTGYVVDRVRQIHPDWRLVGTELFEEGLDKARIRMPEGVELRQMDATQVPYDAEFDVVGAFDVIEHIEPAPEVLAGMFRAVKPGGGLDRLVRLAVAARDDGFPVAEEGRGECGGGTRHGSADQQGLLRRDAAGERADPGWDQLPSRWLAAGDRPPTALKLGMLPADRSKAASGGLFHALDKGLLPSTHW